jgi:hypothetical protein
MRLPSKKKAGDAITADDFNLMIDALAAVPQVTAGEGISVKGGFASLVIALANLGSQYAKFGRITAVQGSDGDRKRDVLYKARPFSEGPQAETDFISPRYLQIIPPEAAIVTARGPDGDTPGDLCVIIRVPNGDGGFTADLAVLTERMIARICSDPPGGIRAGSGTPPIGRVIGSGRGEQGPPSSPPNSGGGSPSPPAGGGVS